MALKVLNATQRKGGNGKQILSTIKNAISFFNERPLQERSTNVALVHKKTLYPPALYSHGRLGSSQQHCGGCLVFLIRLLRRLS